MIREEKRLKEIEAEKIKRDIEKKELYKKITKSLVRQQKIKGKLFYRIIRNDIIYIRKTVEDICNIFKTDGNPVLRLETVKQSICNKKGTYFAKKINATIEKLNVEDYK